MKMLAVNSACRDMVLILPEGRPRFCV